MHALPGVWGPALRAARAAEIAAVRVGLEPLRSLIWRPAAALAEAGIVVSYRLARRQAALLRHADHLRGFALTGRRDFLPRLVDILDSLELGVTELMVHPGYWDARVGDWAGCLTLERERELAALTSDAVRSRLQGRGSS